MKSVLLSGAVALGLVLASSAAVADNPNDPAMRSAAARARDRETIRQLNLAQLRKVQARDAKLAEQWRVWREYQRSHRGDGSGDSGDGGDN